MMSNVSNTSVAEVVCEDDFFCVLVRNSLSRNLTVILSTLGQGPML